MPIKMDSITNKARYSDDSIIDFRSVDLLITQVLILLCSFIQPIMPLPILQTIFLAKFKFVSISF